MRELRLASVLAAALIVLGAAAASAETRETSVPNNYGSLYLGFNKLSNTDIKTTGNDASWFGGPSGQPFSLTFKNMQMQNSVWGGMAFGHWFKQAPVSIGFQGNLDFFPAVVKQQNVVVTDYTINGVQQPTQTFTKYQTNIFQVVPSFNLVAGIPLKFARVYGGVGPGIFMSIYSFSLKNQLGQNVGTVSALGANVGYNAFVGGDFFVSRNWSVFVEGKYSQVNNLSFTPDPSQIGGRTITETYNHLVTQRLAVGASYHF